MAEGRAAQNSVAYGAPGERVKMQILIQSYVSTKLRGDDVRWSTDQTLSSKGTELGRELESHKNQMRSLF